MVWNFAAYFLCSVLDILIFFFFRLNERLGEKRKPLPLKKKKKRPKKKNAVAVLPNVIQCTSSNCNRVHLPISIALQGQ